MGTPILYLLVTFRISSILRSEVRVVLSFSLLMRSSENCMPPKYYRIELKDTGNCVHISNIKDTSMQYIQENHMTHKYRIWLGFL